MILLHFPVHQMFALVEFPLFSVILFLERVEMHVYMQLDVHLYLYVHLDMNLDAIYNATSVTKM